jgi:transposase
MRNVIMIGCDLHDESMLLKIAEGRNTPHVRSFENTSTGRKRMIEYLKKQAEAAGNARIVFAYEASGQGFGLYDELTDAEVECHVLAPTKIARSVRQKSQKTDEKDAQQLLELLRAYVLAGNALPTVWVPDRQTRDDRELVRMRLDVSDKSVSLKAQVQSLLKRNYLRRPKGSGKGWTRRFWGWLQLSLVESEDPENCPLDFSTRAALGSLLRQLRFLEEERELLDEKVNALALSDRYAAQVCELVKIQGVGPLTAIVYLTELGDLSRFANRRQIGAYLGLAPSSNESGKADDRKGHITRQGSSRVRRVLCQASWSRVRYDEKEKAIYQRIKTKNPKNTKVAVVAAMRRLAVKMWHRGLDAQGQPANFACQALAAMG